jgi:hypothetical protein
MAKVSVGLRGWRFDEEEIFTDDGELKPLDEIPEEPRESLYAALLRVHLATDLAARDTVIDLYSVHAFPRPVLRELIVAVEDSAAWAEAWARGERLTGNDAVDALLERWELEVADFHDGSTSRWARASRPIVVLSPPGIASRSQSGTIPDWRISTTSAVSPWAWAAVSIASNCGAKRSTKRRSADS